MKNWFKRMEKKAKKIGSKIQPRKEAYSTVSLQDSAHSELPKTVRLSSVKIGGNPGDRIIGFGLTEKWRDQGVEAAGNAFAMAWFIQDKQTKPLGPVLGAIRIPADKMLYTPKLGEEVIIYLTDLKQTERSNAVLNTWGEDTD